MKVWRALSCRGIIKAAFAAATQQEFNNHMHLCWLGWACIGEQNNSFSRANERGRGLWAPTPIRHALGAVLFTSDCAPHSALLSLHALQLWTLAPSLERGHNLTREPSAGIAALPAYLSVFWNLEHDRLSYLTKNSDPGCLLVCVLAGCEHLLWQQLVLYC
jgi:hypothetical protein